MERPAAISGQCRTHPKLSEFRRVEHFLAKAT